MIDWHRKGFGLFWSWKIRHGKLGRPAVPKEIRQLIRLLSRENPLWGAPHIHGELLKLGIHIGETSVSKYMVRHRKPPSQTWRTFLDNHLKTMVSADFFVVPTIRFQILYVSWCWRMSAGASCTLQSPHIPRRSGRRNRCEKPFRGTPCRGTCCAIAIGSSAMTSSGK